MLADSGASSLSASLRPTAFEGGKESAAITSHGFAAANIRISNNLEIGDEVCNTLVKPTTQGFEIN